MPANQSARARLAWVAIRGLVSLALFVSYEISAFRQVGGMDTGVLVNSSWMSRLGYHAYDDFLTGVPPLFIAGGRLAFQVESSFRALVVFTALVSIMGLIVLDWLLRRAGLSALPSLLVATAVQCATFLPFGLWWYNPLTAVTVSLLLVSLLTFTQNNGRPVSAECFGFLLAAALLSKPNVGPPIAVCALAVAIYLRLGTWYVLRSLITLVVLSVAILAAIGANVADLCRSYRLWSNRVGGLQHAWILAWKNEHMINLGAYISAAVILAGLLVLVFWGARSLNRPSADLFVVALAVGGAVVGALTNNDFKIIDMAPVMAVSAVLSRRLARRSGWARKAAAGICILGLAMMSVDAIALTVRRERVRAVGPGAFYEAGELRAVGGPKFFDGVVSGPRLRAVVHSIGGVLRASDDGRDQSVRVFFGPRIDWAYAAFHRAPPRGLPLWWEAYQGAPAKAPVARFVADEMDLAVFLGNDFTFIPPELQRWLSETRCRIDGGQLTVYAPRERDGRCSSLAVSVRNYLDPGRTSNPEGT